MIQQDQCIQRSIERITMETYRPSAASIVLDSKNEQLILPIDQHDRDPRWSVDELSKRANDSR